jgi:hypothetical protein
MENFLKHGVEDEHDGAEGLESPQLHSGARARAAALKAQPSGAAGVYRNRRRITCKHGKQRLRQRGELVERSFAHAYETGGMRRVHLRRRENLFKRLLIRLRCSNFSLVMRQRMGNGMPRGWQSCSANACLLFICLGTARLAQSTHPRHASPAATIQ